MRKLFGNNIVCKCEYCCYYRSYTKRLLCSKGKEMKDGKCRSFKYNPYQRKPRIKPKLQKFSEEDFKL